MRAVISRKAEFGVPAPEIVADLTGLLTEDGVSITTAALWGCLEATIKFTGDTETAYLAAEQWLADPITIYSDDGIWLWEGRIWSVTYGSGGRRRTRSLEGYANSVHVVYDRINSATNPPTVTAADATANIADGPGQSLYGLIRYVDKPGQLTLTQANTRAARLLNDRKRVMYLPDGSGGTLGQVSDDNGVIELYCVGWYHTLMDWDDLQITTTGDADVSTVIQAVLTAAAIASLSTDYSQMVTTGTNVPQQSNDHSSAGAIIKNRLLSANGFTFGFGQNRIPYLRANGRANTAPTYLEQADGRIEDASGGEVALWSIRPDTILRQVDMVPAGAGLSALAVDSVEAIYLQEVTFQTPGQLSYKTSVVGADGSVEPL